MGTDLRDAARQALKVMQTNAYAVVNEAPHRDVMAYYEAIAALADALEQPEQKPVAYWHKPNQEDEEFIHVQAVNGKCPDCVPLYTHPPRREWRGLTEEEAAACWSVSTVRTWRAIEAALKERNA
jgi:hypothetical protein